MLKVVAWALIAYPQENNSDVSPFEISVSLVTSQSNRITKKMLTENEHTQNAWQHIQFRICGRNVEVNGNQSIYSLMLRRKHLMMPLRRTCALLLYQRIWCLIHKPYATEASIDNKLNVIKFMKIPIMLSLYFMIARPRWVLYI